MRHIPIKLSGMSQRNFILWKQNSKKIINYAVGCLIGENQDIYAVTRNIRYMLLFWIVHAKMNIYFP